jgi:hypothetical protein
MIGIVSQICPGGVEIKLYVFVASKLKCGQCSLHVSRTGILQGHTLRGMEMYQ